MSEIEVRHLTKTFEQKGIVVEALKDINLNIESGDIYGIIGMSGAGKSTLVRCLNYLEKPTDGQVIVAGQDLGTLSEKELRKQRSDIAMIFQHFNLLMQKSVLDNICFPLLIQKVDKQAAKERARELLKIVGLAEKEKAYPAQLSGGQKQRVAIAGVMAMEPKCIVFDEPTAMLDPNGRREVLKAAHDLNRKKGITVLLITHYMEEVVDADYVYVMEKGKIIMDGTPREIFSRVEELKAHRLDVPQMTLLADELQKAGLMIPKGILTREELVDAIMRVK